MSSSSQVFCLAMAIGSMALVGCSSKQVEEDTATQTATDDPPSTDSATTEETTADSATETGSASFDTTEEASDSFNTDDDSETSPVNSECAEGFESYEVLQNDNALTNRGCKFTYKVNNDEVDVFVPIYSGVFPVLIVMQGAKVEKGFYSRFAEYVSSYGVVVAIPNHSSSMGKYFTEQKVFINVWKSLREENGAADSPFFGKIDVGSVSVIGHSFGGTVSANLVQNKCEFPTCSGNLKTPEELKAALFYGFNNLNPLSGNASPVSNIAPVLLIAGELNDPKKTEKMYNAVKSVPRVYAMVKGANHYGIANVNNPKGAKPDTSAPLVEQEEAIRAIADWSGIFLRAYLRNDQNALDYLVNLGYGEDDRVVVQGAF